MKTEVSWVPGWVLSLEQIQVRWEEGKRQQEDVSGGENESDGIPDTFAEEKHFMRMTS